MDKPIEYEQTDTRWASRKYGSSTIKVSGCAPTCCAMVAATLRDKKITPPDAADYIAKRGFYVSGVGTAWAGVTSWLNYYNIPFTLTSYASEVLDALNKGKMVIVTVGKSIWTSAGHFMLAYGIENGKVLLHDPNSEQTVREKGDAAAFRTAFRQGWIIKEEYMAILKNITIRNTDSGELIKVSAVNVDGNNYVKLRDLEKLADIKVDYDAAKNMPTIRRANNG